MKKILLVLFLAFQITSNAQTSRMSDMFGFAPHSQASASASPGSRMSQPLQINGFDSRAYAFNVYLGNIPTGPFQFYLNDLKTVTSIPNTLGSGEFVISACWVNNTWYALTYKFNFVTVDTLTGDLTVIAAEPLPAGNQWDGLTYDFTTSTMYALSTKGTSPYSNTLYTINMTTGALTTVGITGPGAGIISIACDSKGNLFGVDVVADMFGSINKTTGAWTTIGSIGFNANGKQDITFDLETDTLYYADYNISVASSRGELRTIDVTTGATSLVGAFPDSSQVVAFVIPHNKHVGVIDPADASVSLNVSPNPVNDHSQINFSIPKIENVRLEIVDILGKTVSTLLDETLTKGNHTLTMNTEGLKAGIYFCVLNSNGSTQINKLVVVK